MHDFLSVPLLPPSPMPVITTAIQEAIGSGHLRALQLYLDTEGIRAFSASDILGKFRSSKDFITTIEWASPQVANYSEEAVGTFISLATNLWNSLDARDRGADPKEEEWSCGHREAELIQQFLETAKEEIRPEDYDTQEELDAAVAAFQSQWLRTPQEGWGNQSPEVLVQEERTSLGFSRTRWSVELLVRPVKYAKEDVTG